MNIRTAIESQFNLEAQVNLSSFDDRHFKRWIGVIIHLLGLDLVEFTVQMNKHLTTIGPTTQYLSWEKKRDKIILQAMGTFQIKDLVKVLEEMRAEIQTKVDAQRWEAFVASQKR